MDDDIVACIARFRNPRGSLAAERRNRGSTLYDARSGAPIVRSRPASPEGNFEALSWSLWKERWSSTGPLGSTVLPLDDALACIAADETIWATA